MPAGRPSKYTEALAERICLRIIQGEPLRSICRSDGIPALGTIMRWLATIPEFQERYARAKSVQADLMAEQILEIADDSENDITEEGGFNSEHVQRSRLRVDARKWLMAKLAPIKYSDRTHIEHGGSIGRSLDTLTDAELEAIAAGRAGSTPAKKGA